MLMWEALRQATDEVRWPSLAQQQRHLVSCLCTEARPGRNSQELERDPTVMVMGEDVGHYGGSYKASGPSSC